MIPVGRGGRVGSGATGSVGGRLSGFLCFHPPLSKAPRSFFPQNLLSFLRRHLESTRTSEGSAVCVATGPGHC